MKIAVTAASGQLGRAIVEELKQKIGVEHVIGIARTPEKAQDLGIEMRKGDYNSYDDFLLALKGVDRVLLVSGIDPPDKRIQQHRNVIRAAEDNHLQKLVYTSISGATHDTAFDPIITSNRQTEQDIIQAKLDWAIGRNGIYIEPDLEYLNTYVKAGKVTNCAGEGKCAYTSRTELAKAYTQLLLNDQLKGEIYQLGGKPVSQQELVEELNKNYGTALSYESLSVSDYLDDRKKELGDFFGTIVAGIYEGIRKGGFDVASDFERVTGRPHQTLTQMIQAFKEG